MDVVQTSYRYDVASIEFEMQEEEEEEEDTGVLPIIFSRFHLSSADFCCL